MLLSFKDAVRAVTTIETNFVKYKCISKVKLNCKGFMVRVRVILFNATFKNISVISWQSVLLVEETGVLRENH